MITTKTAAVTAAAPSKSKWKPFAGAALMPRMMAANANAAALVKNMLNEIVLDIETQNSFADVGKYDPTLLKVSLVGVYSSATDTYTSYLEHELSQMWPLLEAADRIIGYNIIGFDFPVLNQYYAGDLSKFASLDIMYEIDKKIGFRVKLDDVAQATLGVGKSGHGLQAIEFFRRGEIDKLREYCLMDVKITKEVYEAGLRDRTVKYKDRAGNLVAVPVDFELKKEERKAVNLTMPF